MKLFCILLVAAFGLQAQTANPLSTEVRLAYSQIRTNLLKMADKMPAENYSFKPVPEIETFARRVAHIAEANMRTCSSLSGETRRLGAAAKTAKADLVAALKESFATCDAVFGAMTDAKASEMVSGQIAGPPLPAGELRSRISTLWQVVRHSNEMYGYMAVYLRLKGIVPPSSAPD